MHSGGICSWLVFVICTFARTQHATGTKWCLLFKVNQCKSARMFPPARRCRPRARLYHTVCRHLLQLYLCLVPHDIRLIPQYDLFFAPPNEEYCSCN